MRNLILPLTGLSLFLPLTGLSLFSAGCAQKQEQKTPEMPNVVYVFPDQYRNMAMGFWNEPEFNKNVNFKADPVHTPNINRFAMPKNHSCFRMP